MCTAAEPTLSTREIEVLFHVAQGKTNVEVAESLYLSPLTVKSHLARIVRKLGLEDTELGGNRNVLIREAVRRGHTMPRPRRPLDDLTARELQVAALAAEGLSNAEIGRRIYLSEDTIKTHLRRVYRKLDIKRRPQLVQLFPAAQPASLSA